MKRVWFSAASLTIILAIAGMVAKTPVRPAQKSKYGTFFGYLSSEPTNLDPARGVDVNEGNVQVKIFDGLVQFDNNLRIVPNLAESWEIKDNGKTYIFHLRKGVKFHNGQIFSAKDVLFSFNRLLDPATKSPRTWLLDKVVGAKEFLSGGEPTLADKISAKSPNSKVQADSISIAGIIALDNRTVQIQLVETFAPFLGLLAMPSCSILPIGSKTAIADQTFFEKPSGTGPFLIVDRERDSFIRMKANPIYHGEKPQVDGIEFKIIPESMKAEMDFESESLDILQLYPSNFDRFAERPECKERIHDVRAMNVFYIGFNNQKPPFDDARVRIALNMLVNREAIIRAIYKNRAVAANGSIPPGILGYSKEAPGLPYDPEAGKALLKKAGYGPENPLSFELFQKSSQAAFEITQLIQGELRSHNVQVNLRPMEWSALKDAVNKGEAEAFYMSWFGDYPDGENFLFPLFHSSNWGAGGNRARFKNESVDKMLQESIKIQDPALRADAYDKINRLIVTQAPWLFLWHLNESYLVSPRVNEITFSSMFPLEKGLSIRINPE